MRALAANVKTHADSSGELHEPRWVMRSAFQLLVFGLAQVEALLAAAVYRGWIWLAVLLVIVASHLMHGLLIGLHEASHGMLRENRKFNEFDGIVMGMLSLFSFSLYRSVHQTHHAHLTAERDYEFWPLTQTSLPRWARRLAAFCELNLGLIFTPLIFLRAFLIPHSPIRSRKVRRRIWWELALTVVTWTAIVWTVAAFDWWKYFLWLYLAPAFVAANLQSWRKYIEHVGLTGTTVNAATRSIVAKSWLGRVVAFTLLHEPFHGIHHQRSGLPHFVVPQHTDRLVPQHPEERIPYASYREALLDLLRSLSDPHVGPQWRTHPPAARFRT
ncbi:MAG: fatty acid desaturase [Chthoniobacteraceae bacterium]